MRNLTLRDLLERIEYVQGIYVYDDWGRVEWWSINNSKQKLHL